MPYRIVSDIRIEIDVVLGSDRVSASESSEFRVVVSGSVVREGYLSVILSSCIESCISYEWFVTSTHWCIGVVKVLSVGFSEDSVSIFIYGSSCTTGDSCNTSEVILLIIVVSCGSYDVLSVLSDVLRMSYMDDIIGSSYSVGVFSGFFLGLCSCGWIYGVLGFFYSILSIIDVLYTLVDYLFGSSSSERIIFEGDEEFFTSRFIVST